MGHREIMTGVRTNRQGMHYFINSDISTLFFTGMVGLVGHKHLGSIDMDDEIVTTHYQHLFSMSRLMSL